jgi:aquaporin Z
MGGTAVAIIYSPWGKQSGAHINPAVTLAFLSLGKVAPWDAVFYVVAQFFGAVAGMSVASLALAPWLADPAVHYVTTVPGDGGLWVAFLAEGLISFLLMGVVLTVSNHPSWASRTGLCAGLCVAIFIAFEAPFSGMSMNPARTVGSAILAGEARALWVYFTAPALGMLLAAAVVTRVLVSGNAKAACAKLHHENAKRCIFCEYHGVADGKEFTASPTHPRGRLVPR